ncbi:MAG: GvpL/GvpF family gas vesicle protein [Leptolyngbyaceae cyanobacterium SL_7_1]|nr:GvpL/GvpF family gas vesicle protein [Leptolyngbyaceae cyanobacterium SL_7_1]
MSHAFYLYGIFPAPGPVGLTLEGLDRQPLKTQTIREFTLLYSDAQQERYLTSRRNLLGHEQVLEHAMTEGYRTLLPLQFGLTIHSWDSVDQQLLTPQREALNHLFTKLVGRREVGVKVFWQPEAELEQLMTDNQLLRTQRDRLQGSTLSMDQVIHVGQAIELAIEARQQAIIQVFQQTLNPLAIETVENTLLTHTMIYNAAYLIPWEDESPFGKQVEALDRQFEGRLKIRYNNLTAPYNFARLGE